MASSLQARFEAANAEYEKLQEDLTNAVGVRQRLDAQLSENEQVRKEFLKLQSHNTVYKLIGAVLVKQEQPEAKANVEKRLEFIRGESKRVETQLKDLSEKSEKKKAEIVQIQMAAQAQTQSENKSPAAITS